MTRQQPRKRKDTDDPYEFPDSPQAVAHLIETDPIAQTACAVLLLAYAVIIAAYFYQT